MDFLKKYSCRLAGGRGGFLSDRLARMLPQYPNLYTDLSSLTQINQPGNLGEALRRPEFPHRLVYGTDYPLIKISQLASPWYFPGQLSFRQMWALSGLKNP